MKAMLLSAEKRKALCDELDQENADDLLNDSFQVIYMWGVIWILEYQEMLNAFDDDLEIVKGLIGAYFRGEPLDDQEELPVLGPLDNMPAPPTCDNSMKYRRDWVGQLVWHSFLVMQQEIGVEVQSFPGVKGWLGNHQIDEAFVAFRRGVRRLKNMVINSKDGLGVLRRVIVKGVALEEKIGGGGDGGGGGGGGAGGDDDNGRGGGDNAWEDSGSVDQIENCNQ
ncbi:hypothetical protein QJS10_CPB20g00890 [Acorus calamus]|uniref:Uncharacterized protein n=1 Tax=Acorus calamus TaxID=4465 RepID=A0AAV9C9X3_ACOCL|nr:hypothetical protein QJS10_CPB20g00890 [Acorus calamus]